MKVQFGKSKDKAPKAAKPAKIKAMKEIKPLFSFGKKTNLKPSETGADIALEAAKAQTLKTKTPLDAKKLLTLLIAVLTVVLVALVIKMFVLDAGNNDIVPEAVAPISQEAAAPADVAAEQEVTADPAVASEAPAAPTEAAAAQAEAPAEPTAAPTESATNANAVAAVETAPVVAPASGEPAATNSAPMTYEEFLKETGNKVYRERNTAPGGDLN